MSRSLLKRFANRSPHQARPMVEALDDRQLLSAAPTATMLIPAYFYPKPGGDWDRMAIAAKSVPITAILNPVSGLGASADPVYAAAVDKLESNGGQVIGYVHTSYGKRSLATVEAQVLAYHSFYHLDGIFVDEMATDAADISYYSSLYSFIKNVDPSYEVIGNPGGKTIESYLTAPTADVLVDYEDNQGRGYARKLKASWVSNYTAQHFGNIVGNAVRQTMLADLNRARQRNVGYVYVTDQNLNNFRTAYDRLPRYWNQEVAAIEAENG